jgi:hypothetical protein
VLQLHELGSISIATLAGVLASVLTLAVHDRSERRKVWVGDR